MLGLTLWYKKERAQDNSTISENICRQKERNNESTLVVPNPVQARAYAAQAHNYVSTIKAGAVFNYDGCTYKVIDDFDPLLNTGQCVVTSSSQDQQIINSTKSFEYSFIHDQICAMIQSLFS